MTTNKNGPSAVLMSSLALEELSALLPKFGVDVIGSKECDPATRNVLLIVTGPIIPDAPQVSLHFTKTYDGNKATISLEARPVAHDLP